MHTDFFFFTENFEVDLDLVIALASYADYIDNKSDIDFLMVSPKSKSRSRSPPRSAKFNVNKGVGRGKPRGI